MNQNSQNLKGKIDRILEQNKRQQFHTPFNFVKEQRQSQSSSCQNKSKLNLSQEYNGNQLQINNNHNNKRGRSEYSWQGDNSQSHLRISTTPNGNSCNNKENIFKRNEFLSTKNGSVKNNKAKNIQQDNLTSSSIQLKNNQNYLNTIDKSFSTTEQERSFLGKSTIDNSKILSISKLNDNQYNDCKDSFFQNNTSCINNSFSNDQRQQNALKTNMNINNKQLNINKNQNLLQNCNIDLTNICVNSQTVKQNKENINLNQTTNTTSNNVNKSSPSSNIKPKYINNGNIHIKQGLNQKNNDITNQLIKVIELEKKNSSKQYQQFQNQQHQNSLDNIRKRESFSQQMRQVSQQLDISISSKRGSYFGLIDSKNNYCQSDEDNSQLVSQLKTKYHLRDAIQRQEIQRLQQENANLQDSNKQLNDEVNRYRNIRTMENKYIKQLEKELTEEKQKLQLCFQQYSKNENEIINANKLSNSNSANDKESLVNYNTSLSNIDLQKIPITQQNAFQVAHRQEKIIQVLSEKVNELISEKEYFEQILKNLLLKKEIEKQKINDQFSSELSYYRPSYLSNSFTENSIVNTNKIQCSNTNYANISSKNQLRTNTASQQNYLISLNQLQTPVSKTSETKEDLIKQNQTNKILDASQIQNQEQLFIELSEQPNININQNLSNNSISEKQKTQLQQNTVIQSLNSRTTETLRQIQNRLSNQIESNNPTYDPSSQNSVMSDKRYQDSCEKNSNSYRGSSYIFGPPKSAHKCSYEEQLINKQHQNDKVIFLENGREDQDNFYWDPNCFEFTINEKQLQDMIESYKLKQSNQKIDIE